MQKGDSKWTGRYESDLVPCALATLVGKFVLHSLSFNSSLGLCTCLQFSILWHVAGSHLTDLFQISIIGSLCEIRFLWPPKIRLPWYTGSRTPVPLLQSLYLHCFYIIICMSPTVSPPISLPVLWRQRLVLFLLMVMIWIWFDPKIYMLQSWSSVWWGWGSGPFKRWGLLEGN